MNHKKSFYKIKSALYMWMVYIQLLGYVTAKQRAMLRGRISWLSNELEKLPVRD